MPANLRDTAANVADEVQKAFADLGRGDVEASAKDIERTYTRTFDKIRANAQAVIDAPTPQAALQVIDVASANQAATAAEKQAASLRLVADAAARAAIATEGDASAAKVYAVAAEVAAIGANDHAKALREQATVLQGVQAELDTTSDGFVRSGRKIEVSAGQQRQGMLQVGEQFRQFMTEVQLGINPVQAFMQQSGQAAFALTNFGGTLGRVGEILASVGGTIGLVAVGALASYVMEQLKANSAVDEGVDKLKKDAEQTESTRQSKERFKTTAEGVAAAIRDGTEATKKAIEAEKSAAEQANITAKANLDKEIQIRKATAAALEAAIAQEKIDKQRAGAPGERGELGSLANAESSNRVARLQDQLAKNDAQLGEAESRYAETRIELATETAKRMADPIQKITKLYDDQANAARDAAREAAKANGNVFSDTAKAALQRQLAGIEIAKQAAIKAEQKAEQDRNRTPSLGSTVTAAQGADLLASAEKYRGLSETRDNGTLQSLFAQANEHVDPKITAWCAAFVNAVLATNGLPGTGSLSARSFLQYGTSTEKPVPGDIVVSKRGTGSQGHVGFFQGTDAKGNIRVLGGNTGDKVGTETIAPRDVLGFRRAPSGGDADKRAQEQADKARNNAAEYDNLLTRAQEEQLRLARNRVTDTATAADLDAREIDLERQRLDAAAQKGVADRKWSQAQADALVLINDRNAAMRIDAVRVKEAQDLLSQQIDAEKAAMQSTVESLGLDLRLAKTRKDQLAIELQLLAIQENAVKREAWNVVADPNAKPAEKQRALGRINDVDDQHDRNVQLIQDQHASPFEAWGKDLEKSVGSAAAVKDSLESIAVHGITDLEDGLANSVTSALRLHGVIGSIAGELIKLAEQKLLFSIFGFAAGTVPGKARGMVPGFADGIIRGPGTGTSDSIPGWMEGVGPIRVANGESIINAESTRRYRPVLKAINDGKFPGFASGMIPAGQIYMRPLPNMASIQRPSPAAAPIVFDFRHAVTTEAVLRQVHEISAQYAQVSVVTGSQLAQQESADAAAQRIPT